MKVKFFRDRDEMLHGVRCSVVVHAADDWELRLGEGTYMFGTPEHVREQLARGGIPVDTDGPEWSSVSRHPSLV